MRPFLALCFAAAALVAPSGGGHSPPPAENSPGGGLPPVRVWARWSSGRDLHGFTFAPPRAPGRAISAREAAALAWDEGVPGSPSGFEAVLENVTWPELRIERQDVWAVTYLDACQPIFGPYRPGGLPAELAECVRLPFTTMLGARTGRFLVSYSPGSPERSPPYPR